MSFVHTLFVLFFRSFLLVLFHFHLFSITVLLHPVINVFDYLQMAGGFGVTQLVTPEASDVRTSVFKIGRGAVYPTPFSGLFLSFEVFGQV